MSNDLPQPAEIFKAITIYLQHAYAPGVPPKAVQERVEQLKRTAPEEMMGCVAVEHERNNPTEKHMIRLGNRFYPHMKMCIEERPDHRGYLFRADTHDRHIRPPEGSKEAALFKEVVEKNAALSQEIEGAWAREGIPTFRTYLKEDLARRSGRGEKGAGQ